MRWEKYDVWDAKRNSKGLGMKEETRVMTWILMKESRVGREERRC